MDISFRESERAFLQYTVYFYVCKVFPLYAADEDNNLTVDQFEISQDQEGEFLLFKGKQSKTLQGEGIFSTRKSIPNKQYADKFNPRCIVSLFKGYPGLIPNEG